MSKFVADNPDNFEAMERERMRRAFDPRANICPNCRMAKQRCCAERDQLRAENERALDACEAAIDLLENPDEYKDCQPAYGMLRAAVAQRRKRRTDG